MPSRGLHRALPIAALATLGVATACSDGGGDAARDGRISVVTSTTIVADLVEQVGGNAVAVRSVVPEGADVHTFTFAPSDIRDVSDADLVVIVGADLGSVEERLAESTSGLVVVLTEGMRLRSFGENATSEDDAGEGQEAKRRAPGSVDPHFWMDVGLAIEAIERIREGLAALDAGNEDAYRARAAGYVEELRAVDEEIAQMIARLPPERRFLVTFHDAYGYFAARYGLTILGFVVEGPGEEPSAAAIATLVEDIKARGVPFIFTEPQFSARVVDQVARDTGATIRTLPSGALSEEYPTYVDFLRRIAHGIAD